LIQVKARLRKLADIGHMIRSFASFPLTSGEIAVVYPLVHAVAPDVDLDAWRKFASQLVDDEMAPARGALGLRNAAGYICGLLIYRASLELRHGRVLAVDLFAALDLVGDEPATQALLEAAEAKARELRCAATHIRLDATQRSVANRLVASGHRLEGSVFCRRTGAIPLPS
jgi:hypothetical protein